MSTSNTLYLRCAFTSNYYNELCTNGLRKYMVRFTDIKNTSYICILEETIVFRANRYYEVTYTGMESAVDKWDREYQIPIGIQIVNTITNDAFRASSVLS